MIISISPSLVEGNISAPASKSYAQRAIAIAMLAGGYSTISNIDSGGDVDAVLDIANSMCGGVKLIDKKATIAGGNFDPSQREIFIGESGLATRLFTPIASLLSYPITIKGHGSILTRPIDMMQQPLEDLGVRFESNNGFLPLEVYGAMRGGDIEVDGSLSSQFISGLLISLPLVEDDSVIRVKDLKSKPYIAMTIAMMKLAGVEIVNEDYKTFRIKGKQLYKPLKYNVEGDWSGASCLLVAGAVAGEVTINNLSPKTDQADVAILQALDYAGANMSIGFDSVTVRGGDLQGFSFDATDCPDLFPALAVL
ncbi:MAG: 3-phosphoshikimate 1-carboxyvinyltransferase, partial [Rikenellaceae bacterium]